jgi:hypothetical protein
MRRPAVLVVAICVLLLLGWFGFERLVLSNPAPTPAQAPLYSAVGYLRLPVYTALAIVVAAAAIVAFCEKDSGS